MMAALWEGVARDVASSKRHFGMAVELFRDVEEGVPGKERYRQTMAFLHAMFAGYTSFEAGMKRLLSIVDEPLPKDAEWHKSLLRQVSNPVAGSRPAVVGGRALSKALAGLLGFRHVAAHVYDEFDADRAALAVDNARVYLAEIDGAIARFRAVIDPD